LLLGKEVGKELGRFSSEGKGGGGGGTSSSDISVFIISTTTTSLIYFFEKKHKQSLSFCEGRSIVKFIFLLFRLAAHSLLPRE